MGAVVADVQFDYPELDLYHDGAYWVQDVETRAGADSGLVDATSLADGYADPSTETYTRSGTRPLAYTARGLEWGNPEEEQRGPANTLELSLSGVESVAVWIDAAGLDPTEELTVEAGTDAPATVILRGEFEDRTLNLEAGVSTLVVEPLA